MKQVPFVKSGHHGVACLNTAQNVAYLTNEKIYKN
jgi:hypothetical protein